MAYRNITVDGVKYEYVIGKTHLKIKGHSVVQLSQICTEDHKGRFVASPKIIAEYIKTGKVSKETADSISKNILLEESSAEMRRAASMSDPEDSHIRADHILCDTLKSLGYTKLVNEYYKVYKWYV